jgi:UDP-2,3-diacylglucosamine hydrolase
MSCTLFISDLHLDAQRPATTELFIRFLGDRARRAGALYILGDLFEAWIGDDDDSAHAVTVCDALKSCTDTGVPVFIMHGNRDFLLGGRFTQRSGARLLDDPSSVDLYGEQVLLTHGDLLCTDDTQYQDYRREVRTRGWQQAFLARSLDERRRLAADMRDASYSAQQHKPENITDVSSAAVNAMMQQHGVRQLIHGHTHRPGIHEFSLNGVAVKRMVLGDWYSGSSLLECTPRGCRLESPVTVQPGPSNRP